jgi:uncharacterized protein
MRVVLDTNVLIAAFVARGVCSEILVHCIVHHAVISSEAILGELQEHLVGKFKCTPQQADEAVKLLRSRLAIVAPTPLPHPVCRDSDDDMVLATAVAASADCIVTGDKDLLVIQRYANISILSPSEFAQFEASQSS